MMPRTLRLVLIVILLVCIAAGGLVLADRLTGGRVLAALGRVLPARTQPVDAEQRATAESLHVALAALDTMRERERALAATLRTDSLSYLAARARLLAAISSARQPGTAGAGGESVTADAATPPLPVTGADSVTAGDSSSSAARSHLPPLLGVDARAVDAFVASSDAALRSCYAVRASCAARADSAEHTARRATAALDAANARGRRATLWRIAEDAAMLYVGTRLR